MPTKDKSGALQPFALGHSSADPPFAPALPERPKTCEEPLFRLLRRSRRPHSKAALVRRKGKMEGGREGRRKRGRGRERERERGRERGRGRERERERER